jgi:hypothetical protein
MPNHCRLGYNTACLHADSCLLSPDSATSAVLIPCLVPQTKQETWKELTTCREASQNGEAKARRRKLQLQGRSATVHRAC